MSRHAALQPFDVQPQEAVEIEWSNPLTRGLRFAQVGDSPRNVVGASTLLGAIDGKTYTGGRGLEFTGNAANRIHAETTDVSASGTALAFFYLPSAAGTLERIPIGVFRVGAGLDVGNYLAINGTNALAITTDGDNWIGATWAWDTRDRDWMLVGRFTAGAGRDLWERGILRATRTDVRSPSGINRVVAGTYETTASGNPFWGTLYCSAWWDRVLSDDEVRSVSANPWQMFRSTASGLRVPFSVRTLAPVSTTSNSGWTASAGTAHAAAAAVGGASVSATANGAALALRVG